MGRNGIIVTLVGMLSSFWKLPTQQIPGVIKAAHILVLVHVYLQVMCILKLG